MENSSRPLIILGAGASHDFVNSDLRRYPIPPLTNDLVKVERLNNDYVRKYRDIGDLLSHIAPLVLRKNNPLTFEEALNGVSNHAELSALRFYLGDLFRDISNGDLRQEHVNNYRALIRYINNSPAKGADVLTFNYDTLFESQLNTRFPFMEMNDYITTSEPIRIFKLHGSCDWFYIARKSSFHPSQNITAYEFLRRSPNFIGKTFYTRAMLQEISEAGDFYHIPALAIPTTGTKSFVMPTEHIQKLAQVISNASRILIIGWKAGDTHLLELLNENIKHKIPVFLVTGPRGGQDMKENLTMVRKIEIAGEEAGFSNFIGSTIADTFFELKK